MFPFGKGFEQVEDKMFKGRAFKKHAKNVVTMLDTAVRFLGPDLSDLEETLVELGAKHVGYGILPEHYPIVGQALLETLATALGDVFTEDLRESWGGVYGFITSSMLKGANESLLRYEVEVYGKDKKTITLDEYVSSMLPGQTELYYITMAAEGNFHKMDKLQYAKKLQKAGVVILHIHKNKQDLLTTNLQKYLGRKMVDVASGEIDTVFLKKVKANAKGREKPPTSISVYNGEGLSQKEAEEFCAWFQSVLGEEQVETCTPTCDFASQSARIIHQEQPERRLEDFKSLPKPKKNVELEINLITWCYLVFIWNCE
jgi:hemoglobin-like flavoprotein